MLCHVTLRTFAFSLIVSAVSAAQTLPLWPDKAPGETVALPAEADTTTPKNGTTGGRTVVRLGNVSTPTLQVFRAPAAKDTGAAVVVFPGGGYSILAYDLEGSEVCEWLNSIGVTGILVKYRVPVRKGLPRYAPPLQDAQRAIGLTRQNAKEWGIDPNRVGVLGFSAGGHLAAAASTNYEKRSYDAVDAADALSSRPDFAVLVYPAYLTVKDEGDKISPELTITAQTPPTILIQTEDDGVRVENSVYYFLALKNAKVPAELHVYPKGGHGYGLRPTEAVVTTWPARVEAWMKSNRWLDKH